MDDLNAAMQLVPELMDWGILVAYRGSIVHGTYREGHIDDIDLIGICVPPISHYFGLDTFGSRGTIEVQSDKYDVLVYSSQKLFNLLVKLNPNILQLLWLNSDDYLFVTDAADYLLSNRELFSCKQVWKTFLGYANSQMKRMTTEQKYMGYMGAKRKALVDQFGYDCKNAAHLIRLLRMGIEFLDTGILRVHRQDASELMEIKYGEWPLLKVKHEAQGLFQQLDEAYYDSPLPDKLPLSSINQLAIKVTEMALDERNE